MTPLPAGDTQALPGYVSFYLQLQDPNLISNHRWDCFASYTLAVLNSADRGADLSRESWHRFSSRPARQQTRPLSSSSHGWADFTSAAQVQYLSLQPSEHKGREFNGTALHAFQSNGLPGSPRLGRLYLCSTSALPFLGWLLVTWLPRR